MPDSGYIDTGVVGSYLFPKAFSEEAEAVLRSLQYCYISDLTEVEFYSLAAKKLRTHELSEAQVRHVIMTFESLVGQGHFQRLVMLPEDFARSKYYLSGLQTNLRALDSLHVAIAERLEAVLVTSDKNQAVGAEYFGLDVWRVGGIT